MDNYFIVLILLANILKPYNSEVTLLGKQLEDNSSFTCILEGEARESAISWVTSIEDYKNVESRYIPDSEIINDYESNNTYVDNWKTGSSLNFPFEPLDDPRWESLPTHIADLNKPTFITDFFENSNYFTFSVRLQDKAELQFQNSRTENFVSILFSNTEISFGGECDQKSKIKIPKMDNEWLNVNITYKKFSEKSFITVGLFGSSNQTVYCKRNSSKEDSLWVKSKQHSLWKLHKYSFLYTENKSVMTEITEAIKINPNKTCIFLYLSICETCIINFTMGDRKNSFSKTIKATSQNYSWKPIKLIYNFGKTTNKIPFYTATDIIQTDNIDDIKFWAIDDIRLCDVNEIRTTTIRLKNDNRNEIKCKTYNKPQEVGISKPRTNKIRCNEGTMGTFCNITCQTVSTDFCNKTITCTESGCYCSNGYYGSICEKECDKGAWGLQCKNLCKNCKNEDCEIKTGTCNQGCNGDFIKPKCEVPLKIQNITVVNTTSSSIELSWNGLYMKNGNFTYVVRYTLHKNLACDSSILQPSQKREETQFPNILLNNLLPFSEYAIKVYAKYNKIEGNYTKVFESTKSSDKIMESEYPRNVQIRYDIENEFPVIYWGQEACSKINGPLNCVFEFKCKNEWCNTNNPNITLACVNNKNILKTYNYSTGPLSYYSEYSIELCVERSTRNCFSVQKNFFTKPGPPSAVRNLTAYSRSENDISLRWKPPHPTNGKIQVYIIRYRNRKLVRVAGNSCTLWDDFICANVTNLQENTTYSIEVTAKNVDVKEEGKPEKLFNISTQEDISEPARLINITWNKKNDTPILTWEHPFVTNGPLKKFNIQLQSRDKTSDVSLNYLINQTRSVYSYNLTNLNPCTWYNTTIYPYNKFRGNASKIITFKTPPLTPVFEEPPNIVCNNTCYVYILIPRGISNTSYLNITVNMEEKKSVLTISKLIAKKSRGKLVHFKLYDGTKELKANENFTVDIILENRCLNDARQVSISNLRSNHPYSTENLNESSSSLWIICLCVFIVIVTVTLLVYYSIRTKCLFTNMFGLHNSSVRKKPLDTLTDIKLLPRENKKNDTSPLLYYKRNSHMHCPVSLHNFEAYLKQALKNGEIKRQFQIINDSIPKPSQYGKIAQNESKNRFNNNVAVDHSRVILEKINSDQYSDYINANYIDGYKKPKAYIATQGPMSNTLHDFWRMIWQENVMTIVMMTKVEENGKEKSEQYWPPLNKSIHHDSIVIRHISQQVSPHYTIRIFTITQNEETREVQHVQFTSWPDHKLPCSPQALIPFLRKLQQIEYGPPIVVHCSAGLGRTGTTILCDFVLRMAANEQKIDFLKPLRKMREQRAHLVTNLRQYKLAHLIVLEALNGYDLSLKCTPFNEFEQKVHDLINQNEMHRFKEYSDNTDWQDRALIDSYKPHMSFENNKHKNRYSKIVPGEYGSFYLERFPTNDENSVYINAVEVDGFETQSQFIVTQQPLPHTLTDFWRMILERNITTIVSLNEIDQSDESTCIFWPEENVPKETKCEFVQYVSKEKFTACDVIKVYITSKTTTSITSVINIIVMNKWPSTKAIPENLNFLTDTLLITQKLSTRDTPTVITCYDGATASGVFVTLSFLTENIKFEQICDVCLAVRTVRKSRKEFLQKVEQYQLLFEAVLLYLKQFENYSNFSTDNLV